MQLPASDIVSTPRRSILLVSYHYLPAETPGSRRLDTVARLLSARGWEVLVLTATGSRPGTKDTPGIEVIRTTRAELGEDSHGHAAIASPAVSRIPFLRNLTRFPDKYAWWNFALAPRLVSLVRSRRIDVVLSSSPPHSLHLAVRAARAVAPFRWMAEFRDPWMFPSRRVLPRFSAAMQRHLERGVLQRADCVIANTPGNRDELLAANPGLDPARVRVSTNGYDAALYAPASFPPAPGESADFTYVGEIYAGMLERYGAALASIRARNPGHVPRLAVYGTIDAGEKSRMAALGLDIYIEDRGFVSHEASVAAMKNARTLLVLLPAEERWRTCVPSKLYWYLASRRPVLAIVPEGDASSLVRELKAGEAFSDGDVETLSRRLEDFVQASRRAPLLPVDAGAAARYSMDHVVAELEGVLREVTDGNPA
jgi:glycosyltransferase involved in cell wall biosynthesis